MITAQHRDAQAQSNNNIVGGASSPANAAHVTIPAGQDAPPTAIILFAALR